MDFKKEYQKLVNSLLEGAERAGVSLTKEDIAKRLRLKPAYFYTLTGKSGKVTEDHLSRLKEIFYNELKGNYTAKSAADVPVDVGDTLRIIKARTGVILTALSELLSDKSKRLAAAELSDLEKMVNDQLNADEKI